MASRLATPDVVVAPQHGCPTCKKLVDRDAPATPFCSERCRLIDLGNWLDGRYAIPGEPAEADAPDTDDDE